jgi:hypothetical protein
MEIERCRLDGDEWHLKLRHRGQLIFVAISRAEVEPLIEGVNPSEAHVVQALRGHSEALERAVDAAVLGRDKPGEFASLRIVREWE